MDSKNVLELLFKAAREKGDLEYIFTLVRVDELQCGFPDPLLGLADPIRDMESAQPTLTNFCHLATSWEPLKLLANLIACTQGEPYQLSPFLHLHTGETLERKAPSNVQAVNDTASKADAAGLPTLCELVEHCYPQELFEICEDPTTSANDAKARFGSLVEFLQALLDVYRSERLKYRDEIKLHKLPLFEVLELLVDDIVGLYGFRIYFSNGSSAVFERHHDRVEGRNLTFGPPIGFFVGNLSARRQEWRVGDKRLYQVGLPGRYNVLGEWKPIIYPGDAHPLQKEASAASDDPYVQGALFYMLATGYRCIEFVISTTLELPRQYYKFGKKLHLWKVPRPDQSANTGEWQLYDCWIDLESGDVTELESEINFIARFVNMLTFPFDASSEWRLKYSSTIGRRAIALPTAEDGAIYDIIVNNLPQTNAGAYVEAAIDWFNQGTAAHNPLLKFLNYYIAFETLCTAIAQGEDFGIGYRRLARQDIRDKTGECIRKLYDQKYEADPIEFVRSAYFDCVESIRKQLQGVATFVFGEDHPSTAALFEKRDGYSLTSIRGELAHGGATRILPEHEQRIRARVPEIAQIAREFILRVVLKLKPESALPKWSGTHSFPMHMADPRSCAWLTTESILPTKDWTIRPEWCRP
jgi:hypothetical protein